MTLPLVDERLAAYDDLRFTSVEATTFLNDVMGLFLSTNDIATLEVHTEGWIAGLRFWAFIGTLFETLRCLKRI